MKGNPFIGFVPWIIFWVVSGPSTWEWAALGAALAAIILMIPSIERGNPKILDTATAIFFIVLSLVALFVDRQTLGLLEHYSQLISYGVLAIVAFGSLLFMPFTEQYARETVPREHWDSPTFKRINRVLTAMWGTVFVLLALCQVVYEIAPSQKSLFNWIIPIVLIVGAFKFTAWYPEQQSRRVNQRPPETPSSQRVR